MTPEKLEELKKYYEEAGYVYTENEYFHMFEAPCGTWCEDYSKKDGHGIAYDPTTMIRLHSART